MTRAADRRGRPWVTAVTLARHPDPPYGYIVGLHDRHGWVFPGGRIGPFERSTDAAEREFREETGLIVRVGEQVRAFDWIDHKADHHSIVLVFYGHVDDVEQLRPADDISAVTTRTADELLTDDRTAEVTLRILAWLMPERSEETG